MNNNNLKLDKGSVPFQQGSVRCLLLGQWGSKEWANQQLRYAIAILNNHVAGYDCLPKGRFLDALIIKGLLKEHGFWWQAKILDHHIHRFQGGIRE